MLREILDFDVEEICSQTGLTANNCYVVLYRARHEVAELFGTRVVCCGGGLMLTCKDTTRLLSESQDRELAFTESIVLRMHLMRGVFASLHLI